MKSRLIVNLLLLLAVIVLGLLAWYQPGTEKKAAAPAVTPLKQDQLQRVQIQRPLRNDIVLVRDPDGYWEISAEPVLAADRQQVEALTRLAEQTAVRSYPIAELDLDKLQLDPPYATVTLDNTNIGFGHIEPLEGLRYIRVADQVYLIPDLYQHLIEANASQFFRRRLFAEQSRIAAVRLPDFSVLKADGNWALEPAQAVTADALEVFINNWQEASALQVRYAQASESGYSVEVTLTDPEQSVSFLVTDLEPELVLVRPDLGIEYRMGNIKDQLLSPPRPETAE